MMTDIEIVLSKYFGINNISGDDKINDNSKFYGIAPLYTQNVIKWCYIYGDRNLILILINQVAIKSFTDPHKLDKFLDIIFNDN